MGQLLILIFIPCLLFSFEEDRIKTNNNIKKYSNLEKVLNSMEDNIIISHKKLNYISKTIDEFFTNKYTNEIYQDSYIRIETSLEKTSNESLKFNPNIYLRIHLPKIEKKLTFIIDNEDKLSSHDYEDNNEKIKQDYDKERNAYNIGLLYDTIKKNIYLKFRVRLKFSDNPYIYSKLEAKKDFVINKKNNIILKQELKFSNRKKLDMYSSIRYNYLINEKFLLSSYNQYYINSARKDDNLYNSIRLNHKLTKYSHINYVTYINSNNDDSKFQAKEYKTYISYRKYIRNWLYYDLIPSISWSKENDFNSVNSIKVKLGIIIK